MCAARTGLFSDATERRQRSASRSVAQARVLSRSHSKIEDFAGAVSEPCGISSHRARSRHAGCKEGSRIGLADSESAIL
jgi:hypothetical protein